MTVFTFFVLVFLVSGFDGGQTCLSRSSQQLSYDYGTSELHSSRRDDYATDNNLPTEIIKSILSCIPITLIMAALPFGFAQQLGLQPTQTSTVVLNPLTITATVTQTVIAGSGDGSGDDDGDGGGGGIRGEEGDGGGGTIILAMNDVRAGEESQEVLIRDWFNDLQHQEDLEMEPK